MDATVKSVSERLREAAKLFEERNAAYGNNYKMMGAAMHRLFPEGLTIDSEEKWTRVFFLVMFMMKITRYVKNFLRGGHQDSLDDLTVYAQMLAETDDETRMRKEPPGEAVPAAGNHNHKPPTEAGQTLTVPGGNQYRSVVTSRGLQWVLAISSDGRPAIQPVFAGERVLMRGGVAWHAVRSKGGSGLEWERETAE